MSIGERISRLRNENNLTQKELALKLKISRSSLSLYEIDKREPDANVLIKIADFFDVSTDYLLGRTDEKSVKILSQDEIPRELVERGISEMGINKDRQLTKKEIEQIKNAIKQIESILPKNESDL